jgi:hypothetical protein
MNESSFNKLLSYIYNDLEVISVMSGLRGGAIGIHHKSIGTITSNSFVSISQSSSLFNSISSSTLSSPRTTKRTIETPTTTAATTINTTMNNTTSGVHSRRPILAIFMEEEYTIVLEDESEKQLARLILDLYEQCCFQHNYTLSRQRVQYAVSMTSRTNEKPVQIQSPCEIDEDDDDDVSVGGTYNHDNDGRMSDETDDAMMDDTEDD